MTSTILRIDDPGFDLDAVKALFRAYNGYIESLGVDLAFQDFERELAALPGKYHPGEDGQLYLATWENQPVGCAGIYRFGPEACELKRLYVKPSAQGKGLGKALMHAALADAAQAGYRALLLDSLRRMEAARTMYQAMGFTEIPPYNQNPYPDVYYMRLAL